jgi:hypothetical protein
MVCTQREVDSLNEAIKNNLNIFKFYTPVIDALKRLRGMEEELISRGIIIQQDNL